MLDVAANVFGPHCQVHSRSMRHPQALGRTGGQLRGHGSVARCSCKSVSYVTSWIRIETFYIPERCKVSVARAKGS
eukprot:4174891-Pyramimonas_sp.AAC.1